MSYAADFTVTPIKVYFDSKKATDIITIRNNEDVKLALQLSVFAWTQAKDASDVYTSTEDIILFPKILNLNEREERILRLGTKGKTSSTEMSYRIYIEEIPQPRANTEGSSVRTLMRVGVPVFVKPAISDRKGEIKDVKIMDSVLTFAYANTGNEHSLIQSVKVDGGNFVKEQQGWYILPTGSKTYAFEIPKENCLNTGSMKIDVESERLTVSRQVDVTPDMCGK